MNEVWCIEIWDGVNPVGSLLVNGSIPAPDIILWAVRECYKLDPLCEWVDEQKEENPNWDIKEQMHIAEGNEQTNIYCFNHLPDITICRKTIMSNLSLDASRFITRP